MNLFLAQLLDIFIIQQMGATCRKSERKQMPSVFTLREYEPFPWIRFDLTTENLSRIDAECFLIFTDKKLKINKNCYLLDVSKQVSNKIQEFFDVAMGSKPLTPGTFIIFEAPVPELTFQKVCVVCLDVWAGKMKVKEPLENCLLQCIKRIKQESVNSIAITSFNEEFGIPVDTANRCLVNCIAIESKNLNNVTIVCEDITEASNIKSIFEQVSIAKNKEQGSMREQSVYY